MKIKTLTTTSDRSKCLMLEKSLQKFGYDYHVIEHPWYGFLGKIHETYRYVKTIRTEYTHFLYTDAWDTVAIYPPKLMYVNAKASGVDILVSAERACYPHPEKESRYPANDSPWHFVNGGGWLCEIERFIWLYENNTPADELNDQVWWTDVFLKYQNESWMSLDYGCDVFQTIAFCPDSDFILSAVPYNTVTMSTPVFWHGNGHTPMTKIYELV